MREQSKFVLRFAFYAKLSCYSDFTARNTGLDLLTQHEVLDCEDRMQEGAGMDDTRAALDENFDKTGLGIDHAYQKP